MIITKQKVISVLKALELPMSPYPQTVTPVVGVPSELYEKAAADIIGDFTIKPSLYFHFIEGNLLCGATTKRYEVRLVCEISFRVGEIKWNGNLKAYAFFPAEGMSVGSEMMGDLINFIEALMALKNRKPHAHGS